MQDVCSGYAGHVQGLYRGYVGHVQWVCKVCAGHVQGVCRMCAGCVQGLSEDQTIHWVITTINKGQRFRLTRTDKRFGA